MTIAITTLLPYAASVASAAAGWAVKGWLSRRKEQSAIKGGVVALIHDRLYTIYGECSARKPGPYATVEEIRNADYLYQPYHALGGNGTGTELYSRLKDMPPVPPAEKEKSL